MIVRQLTISFG